MFKEANNFSDAPNNYSKMFESVRKISNNLELFEYVIPKVQKGHTDHQPDQPMA